MDFRSSVGMAKTIHLAVDWHHNESPLGGRSAVDCLLKSARAPFAASALARNDPRLLTKSDPPNRPLAEPTAAQHLAPAVLSVSGPAGYKTLARLRRG
jgi:hypothetical protein